MLKTILISFLLIISVNAYVQEKKLINQDHNLNKAINIFKKDIDLKNASLGFLAIDIKTGEIVAELNPDLSRMPASTQKIISTATALEVLGKNFRFTTKLNYSGNIDTVKKVLNGDIYIQGGADPTLGSKYFDKNYIFIKEWVKAIKDHKIETINGRIIADASFYGTEINSPKWLWEDIGNYYGAGANGLSAFDNMYEIHFQTPNEPDLLTSIIKVEPEIPGLQIINEVRSSEINSDKAYVFGAPYTNLHIIRGTLPKSKSDYVIEGAIPDPAYYLAWYFEKELKNEGISIRGEATTDRLIKFKGDSICFVRKDLHIKFSPGLKSIIEVTNKKSNNLFAEHMFNQIAYKLKNKWANNYAIEAIVDFWKQRGMDTDGFLIYDGSGLSPYNAITPRQMVFVLNYMATKSNNFNEFYESLPVAGESGTLSTVGKNTSAEGAVHAKSGKFTKVIAYSGYANTKSGRKLAFSMSIAYYNCSSSEAKEKLVKLMVAMADFDL